MSDRLVNARTLAAALMKAEPGYWALESDRDRKRQYRERAVRILAAIPPDPRLDALLALVRSRGHEYEVDGRMEWHSVNCLYRKTWAMGDQEDEPFCIAARDALAAFEEKNVFEANAGGPESVIAVYDYEDEGLGGT